jgi:hypothetical protein
MRTTKIAGVIAGAALAAFGGQSALAQDAACSRESLHGLVDHYFAALARHDASSLPVARPARFTENGVERRVGEGLFATAETALLMRSLIDTERCGTVTEAVVNENGRPVLAAVRLQLADGEITEIEHIVAREGEFAFHPAGVLDTAEQDWEGVLEPEARSSRQALIAAASDYFDMFAATPQVSVPFAAACDRWENGTLTTPEHDCSPKGLPLTHTERRFPLQDLETGLVAAFVQFNGSLPAMHLMKLRNGRVEMIQAIIGPPTESSGWPGDWYPGLSSTARTAGLELPASIFGRVPTPRPENASPVRRGLSPRGAPD